MKQQFQFPTMKTRRPMSSNEDPVIVDVLKKQGNGFGWIAKCDNGAYQTIHTVIIDVHHKPKSGCVGDHYTIAENGQILILKGFVFRPIDNIKNPGDDFLSTLVATLLSNVESFDQYNYFRRKYMRYEISRTQGKFFWSAFLQLLIDVTIDWI